MAGVPPWQDAERPQSADQPAHEQRQSATSGALPGSAGALPPEEMLAQRAEVLWQRLADIEQALMVQEWWLMGRALPEARLLAEIASLLAVARGELEHLLTQAFGRAIPRSDQTDQFPTTGIDDAKLNDPQWLAASRNQALILLRHVALAIAPLLQYAEMLRRYAEQLGIAASVIDAFSIVSDRLVELQDALSQPPH